MIPYISIGPGVITIGGVGPVPSTQSLALSRVFLYSGALAARLDVDRERADPWFGVPPGPRATGAKEHGRVVRYQPSEEPQRVVLREHSLEIVCSPGEVRYSDHRLTAREACTLAGVIVELARTVRRLPQSA